MEELACQCRSHDEDRGYPLGLTLNLNAFRSSFLADSDCEMDKSIFSLGANPNAAKWRENDG